MKEKPVFITAREGTHGINIQSITRWHMSEGRLEVIVTEEGKPIHYPFFDEEAKKAHEALLQHSA